MGGSQSANADNDKDKTDGVSSVHTVADKIDRSTGSQFTVIRFHGSSAAAVAGLVFALVILYVIYRIVQWRKARLHTMRDTEMPATKEGGPWQGARHPDFGPFGHGLEGGEGAVNRNRDYDNQGYCLECMSRPSAGLAPYGGDRQAGQGLRAPAEGAGAPDILGGHYNNQ